MYQYKRDQGLFKQGSSAYRMLEELRQKRDSLAQEAAKLARDIGHMGLPGEDYTSDHPKAAMAEMKDLSRKAKVIEKALGDIKKALGR